MASTVISDFRKKLIAHIADKGQCFTKLNTVSQRAVLYYSVNTVTGMKECNSVRQSCWKKSVLTTSLILSLSLTHCTCMAQKC